MNRGFARPLRPRELHSNFSTRNTNTWSYRNTWPRPPALLSESLLLPSSKQPPPMFGPRGATLPPKFYNPQHVMTDKHFNSSNEDHWCETCDRGFKNSSLLESHKKEHQRCNIDGCSFIAHPKVITKHIQMQHSSGLYSKISKLNDPEEIQKWREERRRKFPTKAHIEQKKAEAEEKIERGEKMGLRKRKFPENFHNQKNKFMGPRNKSSMRQRPKKTDKFCPQSKPKHNLPSFTGIRQLCAESDLKEQDDLKNDENFEIEDEVEDLIELNMVKDPVSVCGVINKLIADYKSSTEEESDIVDTQITPINKNSKIIESESFNLEHSTKICKIKKILKDNISNDSNKSEYNGDDSEPEEIKIVKTKEEILTNVNITQDSNNSRENCKLFENSPKKTIEKIVKMNHNMKKKLPSTLLQKLLANEIKHERNVALQCIRYIVKNKYFEQ